MPSRFERLLAPLAVIAGAVLLRVVSGVGFANYDTLYALVWGDQLAGGHTPRYWIPIAPTPHPLVEGLGFVLAPLGGKAIEEVTVALGFLALAGCGWVVYRLGSEWFGRLAGALAAVLLLTRVPVLSYGVRAYVDIPYLLLVLGALLIATRHHRGRTAGGSPAGVLALLALAGLLRPEAWAFSGLYWIYLAVLGHRAAHGVETGAPAGVETLTQLAGLALLAVAAPVLWVLSDLLVTGDALWSLTNTRATAHELGRVTGIGNVPQYVPRRLGEILRPPVLAGAALGGVLSLLWLRRRALVGAAAGVVAVAVLAVSATAGLPINTRYAFLGGAILCLFCGAGVFGWTRLPPGDPRRRPWIVGGAVIAVALLAYAPAQYRSADRELAALRRQQGIQDDLVALVDRHTISLRCGPVGVPNHRPIPLLALRLDASPAEIVSAQVSPISRGVYVDPATAAVERDYTLDRRDPHPLTAALPPGFAPIGQNRAWKIFRRC